MNWQSFQLFNGQLEFRLVLPGVNAENVSGTWLVAPAPVIFEFRFLLAGGFACDIRREVRQSKQKCGFLIDFWTETELAL